LDYAALAMNAPMSKFLARSSLTIGAFQLLCSPAARSGRRHGVDPAPDFP
jgi:hypothetical protein